MICDKKILRISSSSPPILIFIISHSLSFSIILLYSFLFSLFLSFPQYPHLSFKLFNHINHITTYSHLLTQHTYHTYQINNNTTTISSFISIHNTIHHTAQTATIAHTSHSYLLLIHTPIIISTPITAQLSNIFYAT